MIVELHDVTDTSGLWNPGRLYPHLIGEVIDLERDRVLILFRDIDSCAWFDRDMDIRKASPAAQVLYANKTTK